MFFSEATLLFFFERNKLEKIEYANVIDNDHMLCGEYAIFMYLPLSVLCTGYIYSN
jgi:hypothetical protein